MEVADQQQPATTRTSYRCPLTTGPTTSASAWSGPIRKAWSGSRGTGRPSTTTSRRSSCRVRQPKPSAGHQRTRQPELAPPRALTASTRPPLQQARQPVDAVRCHRIRPLRRGPRGDRRGHLAPFNVERQNFDATVTDLHFSFDVGPIRFAAGAGRLVIDEEDARTAGRQHANTCSADSTASSRWCRCPRRRESVPAPRRT